MRSRIMSILYLVVFFNIALLASSCVLLEEFDSYPPPTSPEVSQPSSATTFTDGWSTSPKDLDAQIGERITLDLPANGNPSRIWGTDIYTDDSSIGNAAVHMGLITFATGGKVTIEVVAGRSSYAGSVRNGVTSSSYGTWGASFVFLDDQGQRLPFSTKKVEEQITSPEITQIPAHSEAPRMTDWKTKAVVWRQNPGSRYTVILPPGGSAQTIWGTSVYTDDSSIGTAAVHAGLITFADGGQVTIEMREGQKSYTGSEANGVASKSYGSWPSSFVFVDEQGKVIEQTQQLAHDGSPQPSQEITWNKNATEWRSQVGTKVTLAIPGGGTARRVWGDGIYTDDSSIGTAAVHAGLITFADGGVVTIEILPGQGSYKGTEKYGVSTRSYGSWQGSFRFIK